MNNKGQSLFSDEEIKQQDVMSNFYKVIALFLELDANFLDTKYMPFEKKAINEAIEKLYSDFADFEKRTENRIDISILDDEMKLIKEKEKILLGAKYAISEEYYPVEEFFEMQCEKERLSDPTFSTKVFALCEKLRIEGILEQVTQLSDKSYYSKADTFKQALKYIDYLNTVIENEGKVKTPENIFVPKINEDIIEELFVILGNYFAPKEQFMNFLTGNKIEGKINFLGDQNKLAGIFIDLKITDDIKTISRLQTYEFIKQTFLIKGKPIESKMILEYLKDPSKANKKTFIDISI